MDRRARWRTCWEADLDDREREECEAAAPLD